MGHEKVGVLLLVFNAGEELGRGILQHHPAQIQVDGPDTVAVLGDRNGLGWDRDGF